MSEKRWELETGGPLGTLTGVERGGLLWSVTADRSAAADRRAEGLFRTAVRGLGRLPLAKRGTGFQRQVWEAARAIPIGQTRSYGELAAFVGRPGASRAVGTALGANPWLVVVPCHRVVGADGSLTGFAAGLEAKRWLLEREGVWEKAASTLFGNV